MSCVAFAEHTIAVSQNSLGDTQPSLLVVGDSLSAGYRMQADESWPYLLNTHLEPHGITVINASISGDTAGNGAARLPALIEQYHPAYIFIGLGANDGLRGFQPTATQAKLAEMIEHSQAIEAKVFIMQIRVPPNYGKRYSDRFEAMFSTLSDKYDIPLLPFFLEEVILKDEWMMDDGLHPTAQAQPFISQFIYDALLPHLDD